MPTGMYYARVKIYGKLVRRKLKADGYSKARLRLDDFLKAQRTTRACAELNIARIAHRDLRHLFASSCIESGVDIPTVSRWLGHFDDRALAMRVYGHLRDQHSAEMAIKVTLAAACKPAGKQKRARTPRPRSPKRSRTDPGGNAG